MPTPYELLAKSKPKLSLKDHLIQTEEAACSIFRDRILENWCRFFKADPDRFLHLLRVAALFHDIGKANEEFQKVCHHSNIKQTLRHEWLSALILHLADVREWLSQASNFDFEVVVAAVLSHHMKADVKWADTCQTDNQHLALDLNSEQVQFVLDKIRQILQIYERPPKLPERWDFNENIWKKARKDGNLTGKKTFRDAIRRNYDRRNLHLAVKAGVVAADTAASGLVREGHSIKAWLDEHLHKPRLTLEDLDRDILEPKYQELEKSFEDLYEFQKKAQDLGDCALLLAGCGRGKTLAAYLWVRGVIRRGKYKIGRVLFLYPTRATATEGFKDYVQAAPESDAGLFHGTSDYELERLMKSPDDPNYSSNDYRTDPRLFALGLWGKRYLSATVDRFLAFLSFNYGSTVLLPMLADAAVVLDEVHAYDRRMFDQIVAFLNAFDIPVLCMTATLPQVRRKELEALKLEVYPSDRDELEELAREEERDRYYIRSCERTTAQQAAIEAYQEGKRVLWVVNTVARCQAAARELETEGIEVLCYHSRFKLVHRNQRHEDVVKAFKQSEKPAIAVTTQVCEMSLDLDADVLVTELAPCSSLVQRLGRSNRKGKLHHAEIFVYEPENPKPYTPELLDRAREFLSTVTNRQTYASQKLLAEQLEEYGERETLADGNAPFLTGGYFACSRDESFRDINNWTHDCILQKDVPTAIERIEAKDSTWRELVVSVPNHVKTQDLRDLRFNKIPIIWLLIRDINPMAGILFLRKSPSNSQAKILKYLRIAPNDQYTEKLGFQA